MLGSSRVAAQLAASREGLGSMSDNKVMSLLKIASVAAAAAAVLVAVVVVL
jgi:hypothetical protein